MRNITCHRKGVSGAACVFFRVGMRTSRCLHSRLNNRFTTEDMSRGILSVWDPTGPFQSPNGPRSGQFDLLSRRVKLAPGVLTMVPYRRNSRRPAFLRITYLPLLNVTFSNSLLPASSETATNSGWQALMMWVEDCSLRSEPIEGITFMQV